MVENQNKTLKVGELSDIIYLLERFLQAKKFVG
jgi:hypothetical protein